MCYLALLLSVCSNSAFAQSVSTLIGARAAGIGYSSSCLKDEWSVFNNVAGLANVNNTVASASYDARPLLPGSNRMALVFATPLRLGTLGFGALKFGDDLYSEQIICAGFGNAFGTTSLGAKLNYVQYNATGFGTKGIISISAGGITELIPNLFLGAHIININQPVISRESKERLPTTLIAGLGYLHAKKVYLSTEIEKDLDHDLLWKAGIEYTPLAKVAFRAGFNINPNATFFGTGFRSRKITLDYTLHYSVALSMNHQLSIGYQFPNKHAKVTD